MKLVLDAAEGIGPWARDALAHAGLACALVKENVEALRSVDAPVAGPGAVFASTACPAASHSRPVFTPYRRGSRDPSAAPLSRNGYPSGNEE
jgi:hypothetical protein